MCVSVYGILESIKASESIFYSLKDKFEARDDGVEIVEQFLKANSYIGMSSVKDIQIYLITRSAIFSASSSISIFFPADSIMSLSSSFIPPSATKIRP